MLYNAPFATKESFIHNYSLIINVLCVCNLAQITRRATIKSFYSEERQTNDCAIYIVADDIVVAESAISSARRASFSTR